MNNQKKRLKTKLITAFFIICIYILGQNIPLPYVQVNISPVDQEHTFLWMLQTINGSERQGISIFSLGIMPYMTASILIMLINLGNAKKRRPNSISPMRQARILALILAFVMACMRSGYFAYSRRLAGSFLVTRGFTILVLITGAFFIIWLTDMNSLYGLGGMVAIIMVNIVKTVVRNVIKVMQGFESGSYRGTEDVIKVMVLVTVGLISMIAIMLLEESEKRIPVQRVMIYSEMARDNYMAFKLNPVGIQPMMYTMALYMLPYYIFFALVQVYPDRPVLAVLMYTVQINNPVGLIIYMSVFFILTIVLAMVQIDPSRVAEDMRKSGDCVTGLHPGSETEAYLKKTVLRLSVGSALVLGALLTIPMMLQIFWNLPRELAMIPMSLMFMGGILRNVFLEIRVINELDSYQEVI